MVVTFIVLVVVLVIEKLNLTMCYWTIFSRTSTIRLNEDEYELNPHSSCLIIKFPNP